MTKYPKSFITLLSVFIALSISVQSQDVYDITVSADGSGDYPTIQMAINACKSFPDRRITIHVRNGVYHEKIVVPDCNTRLSIIGESPEKTIISYGDHFGIMNRGRNSTFYTYTLLVEADDFYAENLAIENSSGQVDQAVALHVTADRCAFRNCRILGNQDALYTGGQNSRQYFSGCYIEGTTDFIFGSATVLFDKCTIHSKSNSYITAASTPQGKEFGFVFLDCRLTAAENVQKVYLGRPWRDFARVVFLHCELGNHILPAGWSNWTDTSRDKTAYFAEFENRGPGADNRQRIVWSNQLTKKQAAKYTIRKILAPSIPFEKSYDQWTMGKY